MTFVPYPQNALKAGVFMVLAMASFVINDTFIKLLAGSVPVGQVIFVRGVMATAIIIGMCAKQGVLKDIHYLWDKAVAGRAAFDVAGTVMFITALMHMPIGNLTSINQAAPLVVIAFAAIFLKERVGWRRITAVVVGLIGVAFIAKPEPSTFTVYEGLALLIVLSLAVRDILTRRIGPGVPSLLIALANSLYVTISGAVMMGFEAYEPMTAGQIGHLAVSALFLTSGYMFMVMTLRSGNIAETAPYRYIIVLFSVASGAFVFGEWPDGWAALGMILVVASGLYALHREILLKRTIRPAV
ncbi:DMT family transporter [soil metagenome]